MSGTSLDGVDAAWIQTDGEDVFEIGQGVFRPYSRKERAELLAATEKAQKWNFAGKWREDFKMAAHIVDQAHIEAVQYLVKASGRNVEDFDIMGYHGQTLVHMPPKRNQNGQTLQIGNGDVLAHTFGTQVVYDFRSHDMANGGQGAPLVPIYHRALANVAGLKGNTAFVNIGGVSNLTLIGENGALYASDCGPGNGPIDAWIVKNKAGRYDANGEFAQKGKVDQNLLASWMEDKFFKRDFPRAADRWQFDVQGSLSGKTLEDGAASLAAFCAEAIITSLNGYEVAIDTVLICGGGRKNKYLYNYLKAKLNAKVESVEAVGLDGDFIEAQAFAYLAVRSLRGLPITFQNTTRVKAPLSGGRLVDVE